MEEIHDETYVVVVVDSDEVGVVWCRCDKLGIKHLKSKAAKEYALVVLGENR